MTERIGPGVYRYPARPGQFGYLLRDAQGWVAVDLDVGWVPELPWPLGTSIFTCPSVQPADKQANRAASAPFHEAALLGEAGSHRLLYRPRGRLLFAGHFFDEPRPCASTAESPGGPGSELELLATLLRLDLRATVTASGEVVTEPHRLISTHLEQHRHRRQQILEAIAHGPGTVEGIARFLAARGVSWPPGSDEMHHALRSHLGALVEEGVLTSSHRDDPHRYYVKYGA
ncbi:MAG: winged helix-turn-helix domain-containing protein [Dehalococcoidia bacterium]